MKESAKRIDVEVEVSDGHYPGTYYTDIGIRVRQRRTGIWSVNVAQTSGR